MTRQRTMGKVRRNNETDSTNTYRFRSFIPRSVRLYNRTPVELKHLGHLEWPDFKVLLRKPCMEQVLGPQVNWPNYDEMNGQVLPSDSVLFARGEMIVKKKNGLFIEPYISPYPQPSNSDIGNNDSVGGDDNNDNDSSPSSSLVSSRGISSSLPVSSAIIAVTDLLIELIDKITTLTATDIEDIK